MVELLFVAMLLLRQPVRSPGSSQVHSMIQPFSGVLLGVALGALPLITPSATHAQGLVGADADYSLEVTGSGVPIGSPGSFTVQDPGGPEVNVNLGQGLEWTAEFGANSVVLTQNAGNFTQAAPTTWNFTNFSTANILSVQAAAGTDPGVIASVSPTSIIFNTPAFSVPPGQSPLATYSFTILTGTPQAPVPAPVPALAAAACFGWSRRLRSRCREAHGAASLSLS